MRGKSRLSLFSSHWEQVAWGKLDLALLKLGARALAIAFAAMITALGIDLREKKAFLIRLHGNGLAFSANCDTGGAASTPLGGSNRWLLVVMFVLWSHGLPYLVLDDGAQYLIGELAQAANSFSELGLAICKRFVEGFEVEAAFWNHLKRRDLKHLL